MTGSERCDEILRLIDGALADCELITGGGSDIAAGTVGGRQGGKAAAVTGRSNRRQMLAGSASRL